MKNDYKHLSGTTPPASLWKRFMTFVYSGLIALSVAIIFMSGYRLIAGNWPLAHEPKALASNPDTTAPPPKKVSSLAIPDQQSHSQEPTAILPNADKPQQAVSEPTPDNPSPAEHWKRIKVKNGDNLSSIFQDLGLSNGLLHEILALKGVRSKFRSIRPDDTLKFLLDHKQSFKALHYPLSITDTLVIGLDDKGQLHQKVLVTPIEKKHAFRSGVIKSSLYLAGLEAGLSDNIIMKLANIFGWDIDFILDIRPDDTFEVLYEELYKEGKKIQDGTILAAKFTNQNREFEAIYYEDKNGQSDYFTPGGMSMRKAFLRAPLNFTRISSHFSLGRKHPVLHKIRAHRGTDYAAPRGTPVKASGDGKVLSAGKKGGYGNAVVLQHGQKYTTLYGHLNGFARGIQSGTRVKQGQVIGYVGSTGLATGPHLHYEFRVDGVHRNPLTVSLPKANPIAKSERTHFLEQARSMLALMERYKHENNAIALKRSDSNENSL